jgi:mannosyltransferase
MRARARAHGLAVWWPLVALTILAAALRFSTLGLQSFWYDEAFTPVHVLHPSLWATLRAVAHSENTPPLWYVLAWADTRVFGSGEIALRWPSALAGVATVPVAWAIGRELTGRRATAVATAALVAVNPLLVWYSQEARAYGLFVLCAALAMLCFLRALRAPSAANMAAFALTGALALLSHYFAVLLLVPMALWLLWDRSSRRPALPAVAALGLVGIALLPLISAQGGHGTQWIGEWSLTSRLETIPQYYLTGYSGAPLGHGVELLVALPILAGLGYGLWSALDAAEQRGALLALAVAAGGVLLPLALALLGADYLAPRNLVAAMIPVTALIALITVCRRAGLLVTLTALAFLAITIDVNLSPRLQRGDWRGLANVLRAPLPVARAGAAAGRLGGGGGTAGSPGRATRLGGRAITTVQLGTAPLQYYLPALRPPHRRTVTVSEIDETGYMPLRPGAATPPAPGFRLAARADVNGLIAYRFVSPVPRRVSVATLRARVITLAHPYGFVS